MVQAIRDELKKVDPAHATGYETRADKYVKELEQLREEGKKALKGRTVKAVSFHGALSYFARTFDLQVVDTLQNIAGKDLAPRELQNVADRCAAEGVNIIAIEPQFPQSQRIAEDIAKQVEKLGQIPPKIITIDPLETADAKELDADWYVLRMRENIKRLADALK
jgi:ABC-type Zn uptake system ZnuABC Zn-binding protein ZnuA